MYEDFLKDVVSVVEANTFEDFTLWEKWHEKVDWVQNCSNTGMGVTIGELAGMPVCISLFTCMVNKKKVLFIHPTSMVVDWRLIENWLQENMPNCTERLGGGVRVHSAQNFHNVVWS